MKECYMQCGVLKSKVESPEFGNRKFGIRKPLSHLNFSGS